MVDLTTVLIGRRDGMKLLQHSLPPRTTVEGVSEGLKWWTVETDEGAELVAAFPDSDEPTRRFYFVVKQARVSSPPDSAA